MQWKWLNIFNKLFCLLFVLFFNACASLRLPLNPGDPSWGVQIEWFGHSCFLIKDSVGRTVVIDPYDESVGSESLRLYADAVFITHDHFDHNHIASVRSRVRSLDIIKSTGTNIVAGGLQVLGVPSAHDMFDGAVHGSNTLYVFEMGGLRLAHLGDMGTATLSIEQLQQLGRIDILFIPVGGVTTIAAAEAKTIVDQLRPSVIFPMHFGRVRFYNFDPLSQFTALFDPQHITTIQASHIRFRQSDLPTEPTVVLLSASQK